MRRILDPLRKDAKPNASTLALSVGHVVHELQRDGDQDGIAVSFEICGGILEGAPWSPHSAGWRMA